MKSFGLWYWANHKGDISEASSSLDEENSRLVTNKEDVAEEHEKPEFDLHVNFWSLEDYKHIKSDEIPCLDIGIMVNKYKLIDKLTFFCPFVVGKEDIADLSDKMATKNNANIIFNMDCEIQTNDSYTIIELRDKKNKKLLIFPLIQVIKDVYSVEKGEHGTKIEFKFQNFKKYVNSNPELMKFDTIYIRFRIKWDALRDNIYFDSEPLNKSFESAFSGTRIVDFKINERRNIDEKVRAEIIVNHEVLVNFRKVHFLVMEPSAYDVSSFAEFEMSCRELEEGLWDDYLGTDIDFSKGHILAYHWKTSKKQESFNCLVKVNYSKTRMSTIFVYAMLVIALGVIGSAVVSALNIWSKNDLNTMFYTIIGGIILVFIGIFIGKYSKYLK